MASKVPINIAQALSCAAKVKAGKSCTVAEMKATITLMSQALSTARASAKAAKREAAEAKEMLGRALGRLGL